MDQQRVNKKSQSSDQQSLKRSETSSSLVVGRARDQEEVVADEMAGKALKDWVSAVPVQPVDVSRNSLIRRRRFGVLLPLGVQLTVKS